MENPTPSKFTTRQTLIAIGVVLFLLLIVGLVVYFAGKSKGKLQSTINLSNPVIDNPYDQNNQGNVTSTAEVKQLSEAIYNDMNGSNVVNHDIDTWNRVLSLSDTDFIRVYNEFDTAHQKDSGQSLAQWVNNETAYTLGNLFGTNFGWSNVKDIVLKRMARLNLK